jgi:hypothetical protein
MLPQYEIKINNKSAKSIIFESKPKKVNLKQ